MDPITIAAILAPIAGSLLGRLFSAGDSAEAERLLRAASAEYNIPLPDLKAWTAQELSTGEWDTMPEDFGNKANRDEAIRRISEMGAEGGMDAGSRLALEEARRAGAQQDVQGRASVRQEAQRRGLGGAGEVYGQLFAQQAGANTASMGGLQAAADARARALQALATGGGMAGQAEGQDFQRRAQVAQSKDAIRRFNIEMSRDAQEYANALKQQRFGNQMGLADRRYGAQQDLANIKTGQAAQTRQMAGNIGQGVGMGLSTYQQNRLEQERLKSGGRP